MVSFVINCGAWYHRENIVLDKAVWVISYALSVQHNIEIPPGKIDMYLLCLKIYYDSK